MQDTAIQGQDTTPATSSRAQSVPPVYHSPSLAAAQPQDDSKESGVTIIYPRFKKIDILRLLNNSSRLLFNSPETTPNTDTDPRYAYLYTANIPPPLLNFLKRPTCTLPPYDPISVSSISTPLKPLRSLRERIIETMSSERAGKGSHGALADGQSGSRTSEGDSEGAAQEVMCQDETLPSQ